MADLRRADVDSSLIEEIKGREGGSMSRLHTLALTDRSALLAILRSYGIATVGRRMQLAGLLKRQATTIPIVYLHCGNQPYVECAIRVTLGLQDAPIFLLGDESMASLGRLPRVTFVNLSRFRADASILKLRRHYVHHSSNPESYEWFCFERVLILGRFMREWGLQRIFHLDSDCVLLKPLSEYPLTLHTGLINNDFYHLLGFSSVPSASIHAAVLDVDFCDIFERLIGDVYVKRENGPIWALLYDARRRLEGGGAGGVSDMSFYFMMQKRDDEWKQKTLGLVRTSNLGAVVETAGGPATFMNNIGTGEGPDGQEQFVVDTRTRLMKIECRQGKHVVYDRIHERWVELFCAHFSGSAKYCLSREWLEQHLLLPDGVW
eukprot:CAMPEP_0119304688 /NCGR_PEP_ID=MMETSP1333-20130426/5842_1 /TAXON_ID=418940 /ORGANISM="Scyphosphaera apsteinii, Strain RCC1455" /LENGTH=376 /DNA_ID=CAMNT_0007307611 /DNA_START=255 /DNA_END=1382 /DNA_ORIENTATION=-